MPEGGVDLKELAGRFSREELRELLRTSGKKVHGWHSQCPFDGCRDKGADARTSANIHRGRDGVRWVLSCHSCQKLGDYLEVYQAVHGVALQQAVEQLSGHVSQPAKPVLHLVREPVLSSSDEKLTADQVRKVWKDSVAIADPAGEAYLEGRRLRDAVELGYVRFATEASSSTDVAAKARKGFRVGVLLSSLAGQPLGAQFRTVMEGAEDKLRSLKGSHTRGVYIGRPGEVLGSRCVVVAEGMADTLAALLWVKGEPDTAVIGVPGAGNIASLADALEDAGVDVAGQLWVLLAQHDKGKRGNTSLAAFMGLKAKLQAKGADVVLENEPAGEVKDWALSWQLQQLGEWPPPQVRRFLGGTEDTGETQMSRLTGAAIWDSEEPVEPRYYAADLTTLRYLLSADVPRVNVCGRGEWRLNEMTDDVEYAGTAVQRGDITRIRTNLEVFTGEMGGKRLQFTDTDVRSVMYALAERKRYSPVKEYLERLQHDGVDHFVGLARALGLDEQTQGLEVEFLRRWFISAVARVYQPGCQADSALVFQGEEGQLKSRFFEELGGKWFVRMSAELGTKDSIETARRAWIVELDELDAVKRSKEFSTVKAFITRPADHYVPKWIRESVEVPRRSVMGGTVNDDEFLVDEEGLRRFWVIAIKQRVDRQWVKEHRDQLWAQAVALYRAKELWHLSPEVEQLRRDHTEQFIEVDPWTDQVRSYLAEHRIQEFFRVQDFYGTLQVPPKDQNKLVEKRIAKILKRLKFKKGCEGPEHDRRRGWKRMVPSAG